MVKVTPISSIKKIDRVPTNLLRGKDGRDGVDGKDGKDGKDGRDGLNGKDGANGKDGRDGLNGKDGITTIKEVAFNDSEIKDSICMLERKIESIEGRDREPKQETRGNYFPSGGGQSDIKSTSSDLSLGDGDTVVTCTGTCTITLPDRPREGQIVKIKQGAPSVVVTIDGNGHYIDGDSAQIIQAIDESEKVYTGLQLVFTDKWYVI